MKLIKFYGNIGKGKATMVDDDIYQKLGHLKWYLSPTGYALTILYLGYANDGKKRNKSLLLHRLVMGAQEGQYVDHKNHNTLDNRRQNLRFCTVSQNHANREKKMGTSSKFKGVTRERGKWKASYTINYRAVNLGRFDTETEAAAAYMSAAKKHFGEFAYSGKKGGYGPS